MNGTTLLRASALALGLATLPACSDDEPSNDGDGVAVDGGGGGGGGGGETQGTVSSCDLKADVGYCLDFTPDAPAGIARINCDGAKAALELEGVVNESGSCPTADRVGTCVATINAVTVSYRYYVPRYQTETAQENCAALPGTGGAGGTFTPD